MKRIALVIRGKHSEAHNPNNLDQHADVVLSSGSPIGFYGTANGSSLNRFGLAMVGLKFMTVVK